MYVMLAFQDNRVSGLPASASASATRAPALHLFLSCFWCTAWSHVLYHEMMSALIWAARIYQVQMPCAATPCRGLR